MTTHKTHQHQGAPFPGEYEHRISLAKVREEAGRFGPDWVEHGDLLGYWQREGWGAHWGYSRVEALSWPASTLIGPQPFEEIPF